jgi:hypothetical protein
MDMSHAIPAFRTVPKAEKVLPERRLEQSKSVPRIGGPDEELVIEFRTGEFNEAMRFDGGHHTTQ